MVNYQVLKNFQYGGKEKRIHYKEGEIFIGDPSEQLVKCLLSEKRIEELQVILKKNADELKKKSDEAAKKAEEAKKAVDSLKKDAAKKEEKENK